MKKRSNRFLSTQWMSLLLLIFGFSHLAAAQNPSQIARQAQESYQQGNYPAAVQAYKKLIAAGYHNAALSFNLGNACFKAGKLGEAVLYYEKALALKPNDEATLANLELVRGELTDQIDHTSAPEWWDWLLQPQWIMRPNAWAVLFAVLIWLGLGTFWILRRPGPKPWWLHWASRGILGLSILVLAAAAFSYWNNYHNPSGVILSKETTLRIGPEKASPAIRTLHEGTKVAYLDKIGTWDKVRLSNGQEGWLEGKSTGRIR